jgi:hypothetical protein
MVKCLTQALNPVDSRCEGALLRDSLVLVGSVPSPGRTERVFAPSKGGRVVVDERRRRTPGLVPIALVGASPQHDRVLTGNLTLTCDDARGSPPAHTAASSRTSPPPQRRCGPAPTPARSPPGAAARDPLWSACSAPDAALPRVQRAHEHLRLSSHHHLRQPAFRLTTRPVNPTRLQPQRFLVRH